MSSSRRVDIDKRRSHPTKEDIDTMRRLRAEGRTLDYISAQVNYSAPFCQRFLPNIPLPQGRRNNTEKREAAIKAIKAELFPEEES